MYGIIHCNAKNDAENDGNPRLQFHPCKPQKSSAKNKRKNIGNKRDNQHPKIEKKQRHQAANEQNSKADASEQVGAHVFGIFINEQARAGEFKAA